MIIYSAYERGWDDCARGAPMRNDGKDASLFKAYANGYRECKLSGYEGTKHPTHPKPVRPL